MTLAELIADVRTIEAVDQLYSSPRGGSELKLSGALDENGLPEIASVTTLATASGITYLILLDDELPYVMQVDNDSKIGTLPAGAHRLTYDGAFNYAALVVGGLILSAITIRGVRIGR